MEQRLQNYTGDTEIVIATVQLFITSMPRLLAEPSTVLQMLSSGIPANAGSFDLISAIS